MNTPVSYQGFLLGCLAFLPSVAFPATLPAADSDDPGTSTVAEEQEAAGAERGSRPQGLGQLLIQDAQSDSPVRLNVARYHVNVVIQPPVALVQIDQSFYNPYNRQQEGQFVFNLPHGASVSRFAMYVTRTELIEGELIERKRAAQIYDSIVRRRRDPAILEQIGDNLFKMRVFPVFARDEKRILLDYTLPLEPQDGVYEFRLPLLSDLSPIWDFRVTGTVRGAIKEDSVVCASHPDSTIRTGEDGTVSLEIQKHNCQPETDLVVTFSRQVERSPTLRTFVAKSLPGQDDKPDRSPRQKATYFLAEIPPEANRDADSPADVLVLADTSSSMQDLAPVRRTVQKIAGSLRPEDRLRIACADVGLRPLHDGWLSAADPELARAVERLDREFSLGGTDVRGCLHEAVRDFAGDPGERRRLIVYVGDGGDESPRAPGPLPGHISPPWLEQACAALMAVAVQGCDVPTRSLRSLAESSGGIWFDLTGDVRAQGRLDNWLRAGLPSPERIQRVTVDGVAPDDLYWPTAWPPGEPLYVYGRMSKGRRVKLRLESGRGAQADSRQWTLTDTKAEDDVFVGRLWAQRRLDDLRRQGANNEDTQKQIVALSQEWSLLSPHTAFLVLETEADYERWGIDRLVRHRYWKPPDARPEAPLPADWLDEATAPTAERIPQEQFEEAVQRAREALANGNHALARSLLRSVRNSPRASTSAEYAELNRRVQESIRAETLVQSQGAYRALLDPTAPKPWWSVQPSILTLVGTAFRASPDFLRKHPYADALMQEVDIWSLDDGRTLQDFADTLADLTGGNVILASRELEDMGIGPDVPIGREPPRQIPPPRRSAPNGADPFANPFGGSGEQTSAPDNPLTDSTGPPDAANDPFAPSTDGTQLVRREVPQEDGNETPGMRPISLRSCVAHLLRPLDLVMIEEPHRLLITTQEHAEELLTTEVYPVADLLFTDRVVDLPSLMNNPYRDRHEATRRRIEASLKQPMSVDYTDTPLETVISDLAGFLNDAVLFDEQALEDVGLPTDQPVSARYRDVPAKEALRWILDELDLTYAIWDEALVITTPEEAEMRLEVRLHSGRGLLYEFPASSSIFEQTMPGMMGTMGFGGGFGGMGGAMGGMGGSFGGGMGGMGMPGGLGSGGAGFAAGDAVAGVGLSSGGDGQPVPESTGDAPAVTAGAGGASSDPGLPTDLDPEPPAEEQFLIDVDSPMELVTSSIAPTTWDWVGGPGSIEFFPNTLDFVVAQTSDVHEQVESLFQRLKSLPPQLDDRLGGRPATVRSPTSGRLSVPDFDTMIDLITTTIGPVTWDDVGGPGSIESDVPRSALVVSQTADIHDGLSRLLTLLRRSRYEAVHGSRPWDAAVGGLAVGPKEAADWHSLESLPELTAAKPDELRLLQIRGDSKEGAWGWRRTEVGSGSDDILMRRSADRWECRMSDCIVRTDGDIAAVAWPGLRLVEVSDHGEAIRRVIDAGIPWLSHRSNREIAQLFHVRPVLAPPETARGEDVPGCLQLVPAGLPVDGGTYLRMAFRRSGGQVSGWESYVGGELTARIQFVVSDPGHDLATAALEDAAGRELVRWESIEPDFGDDQIPKVTAGWDGYTQLDRRERPSAQEDPFADALAAIGEFNWSAASRQLNRMIDRRGFHPVLVLLDAWCRENDPRIGPRERMLDELAKVVESAKSSWARRVIAEGFPTLTDDERYAILVRQPQDARSVDSCRQLAELAMALGKRTEALDHVERAFALGAAGDPHEPTLRCLQVQLLLELDRETDALAVVDAWAASDEVRAEDLAAIGEVLGRHDEQQAAEELFASALAEDDLDDAERYGLLRRLADTRRGVTRWEAILQAAELQPPDSPARRACLVILRKELRTTAHAELAGQLAAQTEDPDLAAELQIRQAELTSDARLAADLTRDVYEQNRLRDERLAWATQVWYRAGDMARIIQVCEQQLRAGRRLPANVLIDLAAAYRATGRERDAERAATQDRQPAADSPPADAFPRRRMGGGMF